MRLRIADVMIESTARPVGLFASPTDVVVCRQRFIIHLVVARPRRRETSGDPLRDAPVATVRGSSSHT